METISHTKHIFLKNIFFIIIQISMECNPVVPVDNKSTLVEVMAWHQIGDKLLHEPVMVNVSDDIKHI